LQDLVEVFGSRVTEKLEGLIDEYGVEEAFQVEFWNCKDIKFSVMIHSPSADHERALMELLFLCPITNLCYGNDADW
jgi:hypothetical protein